MERMRSVAVGLLAVLVLGTPAQAAKTPVESGPGWVIESGKYTGEVKDEIVRLEGTLNIRLTRNGSVVVPLRIAEATVTDVKLEKKAGEAHVGLMAGGYALFAGKKGLYQVQVSCATVIVQDNGFEGFNLWIPQATFSTLELQVPRKDLDLRREDQLYTDSRVDEKKQAVVLTAKLGAQDRVDLRWRTRPAAAVEVEPVIYGEVSSLVRVEEQLARLSAFIDYRPAQGQARELKVQLPAGLNVLNVRGAAIEDWRVTDADANTDAHAKKVLAITLAAPIKDQPYRLMLEAEETIAADAAQYSVPEITLIGVKQERGFIAIAREGSLELAADSAEGINRVDTRELPSEMAQAAGISPSLAFRYHQHPYTLTLGLTRHDDHPVLSAVAERGELTSVVSKRGEILTRAAYWVRSNKRQFLAAQLPDDADLWSCLVAGRSVKPVKGEAGSLLIPLDGAGEGETGASVEMVYVQKHKELSRVGTLSLRGPVLDVPTTVANWAVYAPNEVKPLRVRGNVQRGASEETFIGDPFTSQPWVEPSPVDAFSARKVVADLAESAQDAARLAAPAAAGAGMVPMAAAFLGRRSQGYGMNASRQLAGLSGDDSAAYSSNPDIAREAVTRYAGTGATVAEGSYGYTGEISFGSMQRGSSNFGDNNNRIPADGTDTQSALLPAGGGLRGESGILPLKIRLPRAGTVHRFSRLMTTIEPLTLDLTFVRVPAVPAQVPIASVVLLLPVGCIVLARRLLA